MHNLQKSAQITIARKFFTLTTTKWTFHEINDVRSLYCLLA